MPAVTLRLRLTIAALTIAAAVSGAFSVSSAPAQTQPKPTLVATPALIAFHAEQEQDLSNLKVIGLALVMYERDNHYRFPNADKWMDQITPYLEQIALYRRDRSVFYDPFQPGKRRYGYAFNRNCSQKPLSAFDMPASTVAIYESSVGTRNASDTGQSPFIHSVARPGMTPWTGSGYGFADGHAKWLRPNQGPYGDAPVSFALNGGQPNASTMLSDRVLALRRFATGLAKGQERGTALTADSSTLNQAQFLAGLTPVQGPGVVVTLRDSKKSFPYPKGFPAGMMPPNIIHDTDINQVVNELKAAGAEAIAVNNQRLVALSSVRCIGPTVYVNNRPLVAPYTIQAIGDPKTLTTMLTASGGIASQITQFDPAMFSVRQAATLTLPAYAGSGEMRYAKPVSAADVPVTPAPPSKVIVTLDDKGSYFLDGVQLPEAQIEPFLAARARQNPNVTAVIKADKNQPYSRVVRLLDMAKQASVHSIKITQATSNGVQPASGSETTPTMAQTHTIIGYGLVSFMLSKHLYCHAVEHSEAARLGIPIKSNSEIIGVNGGPVPKTAAQFVAICRTAPPLRLLLKPVELKNFTHKTQSVTFQTKTPFTVITDAARAEELGKDLKSAQADAAAAKVAQAHTNQRLVAAIQAVLPQASSSTLAKALNFEKRIGWTLSGQKLWIESKATSQKKNHPQSIAKFQRYEEEASARLVRATAEENALFPKTTGTPQALSRIHALAEQSYNESVMSMEKQIQAMAIASVMQQRSPDVAV